ncbi:hypothetical protein A0J61_05080, partial [Choanephora cucurbitarum]
STGEHHAPPLPLYLISSETCLTKCTWRLSSTMLHPLAFLQSQVFTKALLSFSPFLYSIYDLPSLLCPQFLSDTLSPV